MLTRRQAEVLGLLARGLTFLEVAVLLGLSVQTVKDHGKHARKRLGARNTAHAVAVALHRRLIVP